jgi:hypothetical protein
MAVEEKCVLLQPIIISLYETDCPLQRPGSPSFLLAQAIFKPNPFPYNTPHFSNLVHSSHLPAYEDGTECSETSAYKIHTSGNYPEESIHHSEHGKSLKSGIVKRLRLPCDVTPRSMKNLFLFSYLLISS